MAQLSPFTAKGIQFEVPPQYPTTGRGSGRARCFIKGIRAAGANKSELACPYAPGKGSGSWRLAWFEGFEAFHAAKKWRSA